jgi:hypothetical protein
VFAVVCNTATKTRLFRLSASDGESIRRSNVDPSGQRRSVLSPSKVMNNSMYDLENDFGINKCNMRGLETSEAS